MKAAARQLTALYRRCMSRLPLKLWPTRPPWALIDVHSRMVRHQLSQGTPRQKKYRPEGKTRNGPPAAAAMTLSTPTPLAHQSPNSRSPKTIKRPCPNDLTKDWMVYVYTRGSVSRLRGPSCPSEGKRARRLERLPRKWSSVCQESLVTCGAGAVQKKEPQSFAEVCQGWKSVLERNCTKRKSHKKSEKSTR